ncbi:MAG: hypothetical protein O6761_05450 [Thaumarchaeota archaeon]|nr:hypothetical protein [Nitrososphaerota archaeon]
MIIPDPYTSKQIKYLKDKSKTAQIFGSKCIGCGKKYNSSFAFHHLWYIENEKIYKDFKTTEDYNLYILPIINRNRERFRLVCGDCHAIIEQTKKKDFSKLHQFYTLSRDILPFFIKEYCDIWTTHEKDLKQYLRIVFAGKGNKTSLKILEQITNGSLDAWDKGVNWRDDEFWF